MLDLAGKKILITGGAGFLGSHVVDGLMARGCDSKDLYIARRVSYDLSVQEDARDLFDRENFEIVIHMAAHTGGIGASRANPGRFFYENLMIGTNVIEQARAHEVKKVVCIGTVCSYPKFASVPFREDEIWDGYPEETNGPIGMAKKMMIVQAQAYRQEYGTNAIVLLPVNLYGPKDNFDLDTSHVIPALIRKIDIAMTVKEREVEVWGDGSPTREFLYVSDAAEGILKATEHYDSAAPVNLGNGDEISIQNLAEMIAGIMGYEGKFTWDDSKPNGQPRRKLNTARAKEFGFTAKMPLMAGLQETVKWWKGIRYHFN